MRIFVYEHVTGGGLLGEDAAPFKHLLPEARAMQRCVAADFAALPDVVVEVLLDGRMPRTSNDALERISPHFAASADDRDKKFETLVKNCDGVLLVAPETGGTLARLARRVERLGGRLLSPSSSFCEWASDKSRVADACREIGAPAPDGIRLAADDPWPSDFPTPAVLKPNDGCGSQGVRLVAEPRRDLRSCDFRDWRLERFVAGRAASAAILAGSRSRIPLPACTQHLADDGTFAYGGGSCPLESSLAARAEALTRRAAAAMPSWTGYIGIDLVLGPADDGSEDYVIEVNPRLTTSYVGLRALSQTNLAQAMLDVAAGREPVLAWRDEVIEFDADGTIRERGASPAANR